MPINFSLRKYKNPIFIETGTFKGEGIWKALRAGFKKIYSIEISERLYKNLLINFDKEIKSGRVNLVLGDSSKCLNEIIKDIDCRITFWLDAHFSGGDTARGNKDVVLLQELDAIARHPIKTHTILIDDVRLFGTNQNIDWLDIKINLIVKKLKEINYNYSIYYEQGFLKNDVLIADIPHCNFDVIMGRIEEPYMGILNTIKKNISKVFRISKNKKFRD